MQRLSQNILKDENLVIHIMTSASQKACCQAVPHGQSTAGSFGKGHLEEYDIVAVSLRTLV